MNPEDEDRLALELAIRTRKNLEFIYREKANGADVEEFTQMINSMQSMVVALREDDFKGRTVSWGSVRAQGLEPVDITEKAPTTEQPLLEQSTSFSHLISRVRHAFSHRRYALIGSPNITGIRLWNLPTNSLDNPQSRTWEAELSEDQLRALAYLLLDYLRKDWGKT